MTTLANTSAVFRPARRSGELLYISGQLPLRDGRLVATGIVGDSVSVAEAADAAVACAELVMSVAIAELGSIDAIDHLVRIVGYVAATAEFCDHPAVIDAASRRFLDLLGPDRGAHSRAAIGVASLPRGAAVEIEAIFALPR
jgi:enamine deaminase RidA (YjgF/YER057c/UK114 family)